MPVPVKLTYQDLESLPEDGNRYELHQGEVFVSAAPRIDHQRLVISLARFLQDVVEPRGLGTVLLGSMFISARRTSLTPTLSSWRAPTASESPRSSSAARLT